MFLFVYVSVTSASDLGCDTLDVPVSPYLGEEKFSLRSQFLVGPRKAPIISLCNIFLLQEWE
jgi:hypothetical protein